MDSKAFSDIDSDWFDESENQTVEIINLNPVAASASEIADNIQQTNFTFDDNEENSIENISIEETIKRDPNKIDANELIHFECTISYFIQVLLENSIGKKIKTDTEIKVSNLDCEKIKDIISYLKWIANSCESLANRIGQALIIYNESTKPSIIRSSYNFCSKSVQCKNFYSKNELPTCKEHHYVHCILKYDIDSVIHYLEYVIKHSVVMSDEELNNLYSSIKTICFVTRHMSREINYIHYITKNNSNCFHRNNPADFKKKNCHIKKNQIQKKNFQKNKNGTGNNDKSKKTPIVNLNYNRYSILSEL